MSRRIVYSLDWRQAEEVRRRRRAGETWRSIADWLGWSGGNASQNVPAALSRAPEPPGGGDDADSFYLRREAAVALAEADPVLSRRCAKCGRPNYDLRHAGGGGYAPVPVGFVRIGGRWLCPGCAPRRPKPTHGQRLWGESPDAYGLVR
jgi:hypothetical protein